jgi:hypothetical protein
MMVQKSHITQWGGVIILGLLMVGLLVLTHRLALSLGWREALDVGILFLSYGLLALWLQKNSSVLVQDQAERGNTTMIVIEPSPSSQVPRPFSLMADREADLPVRGA